MKTQKYMAQILKTLCLAQELALGVLAGILKIGTAMPQLNERASNELVGIRGVRSLLHLVKDGYEKLQVFVCLRCVSGKIYWHRQNKILRATDICTCNIHIFYCVKMDHQRIAHARDVHRHIKSVQVGGE